MRTMSVVLTLLVPKGVLSIAPWKSEINTTERHGLAVWLCQTLREERAREQSMRWLRAKCGPALFVRFVMQPRGHRPSREDRALGGGAAGRGWRWAEPRVGSMQSTNGASSGCIHQRARQVIRTQIYLTRRQRDRLAAIAGSSNRRQSELIREAVDRFLEQHGRDRRQSVLRAAAGIWKDRADRLSLRGLRNTWDRD